MPIACVPALPLRRLLAAAAFLIVGFMAAPEAAVAQVVVLVNGAPVTELDIVHRTKLTQISTNKVPTRLQVISELIDEHLKVFIAKRYTLEISESDIDQAFAGMSQRAHMSPQQMAQTLTTRGIVISTLRSKIRADLAWSQLVRGKFGQSLQIGEADINSALQSRNADEKNAVGYIYTLYPIVLIMPRGTTEGSIDAKRREAENLRSRFQSCADGLKLARALRDVAVREPISRSSADLQPQLREMLGSIEVGRLTSPEATPQGLQMFAVCEKKQSTDASPLKREMREEIYAKRYEAESKKFLDEVRRQAMIEYR